MVLLKWLLYPRILDIGLISRRLGPAAIGGW